MSLKNCEMLVKCSEIDKDTCWYCLWTMVLDLWWLLHGLQFSSCAQLCPTLCNPMGCNTSDFPVHYQPPEPTQTHVLWVGDAIQPSYPLLSPSSLAFHLAHHQGLFQGVSFSHQVANLLEFQLQHQSFQWIFRIDFL